MNPRVSRAGDGDSLHPRKTALPPWENTGALGG